MEGITLNNIARFDSCPCRTIAGVLLLSLTSCFVFLAGRIPLRGACGFVMLAVAFFWLAGGFGFGCHFRRRRLALGVWAFLTSLWALPAVSLICTMLCEC